MADALAHLGDALVTDQQYDRAKTIFEQLVDREPESDSAKRKLNHVLRKLGLAEGGESRTSCPKKTCVRKFRNPRLPGCLATTKRLLAECQRPRLRPPPATRAR